MKRSLIIAALLTPSFAYAQPVDESPPVPESATSPIDEAGTDHSPPVKSDIPSDGRRVNRSPCQTAVHHRLLHVTAWSELDADQCDQIRPAFPFWNTHLVLSVEVVGQGRYSVQSGDNFSEFRLDRGEAGIRVPIGDYAAGEVRLESVRSAQDGGALGIDGDSTVMRVKYADVMGHVEIGGFDLEGAMGFIPDPWIGALEMSYSLKPLSRTGSERLLGWQTADLAGMLRAAYGPVRLTVNLGNGEGQRYPERNDGKTTTGVLEVVALHDHAARVTLLGMGRDGSIGPSRIRDKRVGGGATAVLEAVRLGGEVVRAWGIGDQGGAKGTEIGGWAEVNLDHKYFVGAHGSTLGYSAGGRSSTFGGAISYGDSGWGNGAARSDVRVWLAVDRITNSGGAMPLAGADAGDQTVIMLMLSGNAVYAPKGD